MISLGEGVGLVEIDALEVDARRLLAHLDEGRELSVRLTDDAEIRALNALYRDKDAATDVLSFPQEPPLLGDVVISLDTAARQAGERAHPLAIELRVLLVHGLCHLRGHDHHTDREAREMAAAEAELLDVIGVQARGLVAAALG